MEPLHIALDIACRTVKAEWEIGRTQSGGWQLFFLENGGAIINYLTNPCLMNLGEPGKPYQVNCYNIANYQTLEEALNHVATKHKKKPAQTVTA